MVTIGSPAEHGTHACQSTVARSHKGDRLGAAGGCCFAAVELLCGAMAAFEIHKKFMCGLAFVQTVFIVLSIRNMIEWHTRKHRRTHRSTYLFFFRGWH